MTSLRTILVDDEPRGLNSMQKLLQLNCPDVCIVGACTNVDEAIEKIDQLEPHLVFLDIAMPVKNGFYLLNEFNDHVFELFFVSYLYQFQSYSTH